MAPLDPRHAAFPSDDLVLASTKAPSCWGGTACGLRHENYREPSTTNSPSQWIVVRPAPPSVTATNRGTLKISQPQMGRAACKLVEADGIGPGACGIGLPRQNTIEHSTADIPKHKADKQPSCTK